MAMTNEEKIEYNRRWRREHPEQCKVYRTEYRKKHKEKLAKYASDYYHKRMEEDPEYKNKRHKYYTAYYKNHKGTICGKIDPKYRKRYLKNYQKIKIWYGCCPYTLLQRYKLKCKNNAFVAGIPFEVYLAMSAIWDKPTKISIIWEIGRGKRIEDVKSEIEHFGFDFEDETFKYMIKCLNESHGKLDFLKRFLENPQVLDFKNNGKRLIYMEDFIPGKKRCPEIIYSKEVNNGQ